MQGVLNFPPLPPPPPVDYEGMARARFARLLADLRRGKPLTVANVRMWRTITPQMAEWLPAAEALRTISAVTSAIEVAAEQEEAL